AASPLPTMSSVMPTMGMVWVARCAARMAGSPKVTMRSTFCATSSLTSAGARSLRASVHKQKADVASLFPANRLHVSPKRFGEGLQHILSIGPQHPDYGHAILLRACRERPRDRAAEERDELAPPHVGHRAFLPPWRASRSTACSTYPTEAGKSLGQA